VSLYQPTGATCIQRKGFHLLRDTKSQLREERDEAVALLQRVEASRNDLARQQGQYKGRIAKVMTSPASSI